MKSLVFASLVLSASLVMTASGQVKSVAVANQPSSKPATDQNPASETRVRVLRPATSVVSSTDKPAGSTTPQGPTRTDFNNHSDAARYRANVPAATPADSAKKISNASLDGAKPESSRAGHAV